MSRRGLDGVEIGGYRIINLLGAGGMGQVYRAVNTRNGHVIAIKALSLEKSDNMAVERFLNEARIQSSLKHPNIVSLYDCIETDGNLYILMEYVDGRTLTELIRQSNGLNQSDLIEIFGALIQAVSYLHGRGVIHRDLKSDNIKISTNRQVKILDFGISKSKSSANLTVADSVVGTIGYLSPEQLHGEIANVQSDIWALGILLYEMVTGSLPFNAPTIGELCEQIKRGRYIPLGTIAPNTDPLIVRIVEKCLQQKPENRFLSAEDIGKEMKIGIALPHLMPPKVTYNPRLLLRLLALAGLTIVFALIGLKLWQYYKSSRQVSDKLSRPINTDVNETKIHVDVKEGTAEVYWNNSYKGKTPLFIIAESDEQFTLVLKQDGFEDFQFNGTVTEQTKNACTSLWMKKAE